MEQTETKQTQDEVQLTTDEMKEEALKKHRLRYTVPYHATSYDEVDAMHKQLEIREQVQHEFFLFNSIAENILFTDYEMLDNGENFVSKMADLAQQFTSRITNLVSEDNLFVKSGNVCVFKGADGQMYWSGIPTNKFQDQDNPPDILSDASHRNFVDMLDKGKAEYPDLYIWHIEKSVGKATWVSYDERGFLLAGGTIAKEYEDYVTNLLKNSDEPIGMSHGMLMTDIVRSETEPNVIVEYKSFEFSFLPLTSAANELTTFTLNE